MMNTPLSPHDEFVDAVRDALAHLYDPIHLQSHPLANLLSGPAGADRVTRAQKLRQTLLAAVERLNPAIGGAVPSPEATISYSALTYRYVDGLSPEEIAALLAVSPRQVYRKLREGVEAVACLLRDQLNLPTHPAPTLLERSDAEQLPAGDGPADRRHLAAAAVQQLGAHAQPELLEIHAVLEGVVKDLGSYCRQCGAAIALTPAPVPIHLYADRAMLRQALLNLITTSLDEMALRALSIMVCPGPGRLTIALQGESRATSDLSPSTAIKGSAREGIGREIAVRLIEMAGGQVCWGEADGDTAWQATIELPKAGPQHILVIDDMSDLTSLFQRFTTQYAVEVIGAQSAAQAFEALNSLTPALILLDVMLPRQDGWEILQTLKANAATASIPVVICSVLNEPGLAAALGADGYLRKPVTQEALLQELRRWLVLTPAPAAAAASLVSSPMSPPLAPAAASSSPPAAD